MRFPAEQSHQVRSVLRLRPGETVVVLDGSGQEMLVRLSDVGWEVVGAIEERRPNQSEPAANLVLYQGLLKGAKLDLVLQKGTEIGVAAFVPVSTARSVPEGTSETKQMRYQVIVREAAEQSGRGTIPQVQSAISFRNALAAAEGTLIVPWEQETAVHLQDVPLTKGETVSLFIGPEGGFTREEAEVARGSGAHLVTLGRRILRAETAAIVASALVLARLGELG